MYRMPVTPSRYHHLGLATALACALGGIGLSAWAAPPEEIILIDEAPADGEVILIDAAPSGPANPEEIILAPAPNAPVAPASAPERAVTLTLERAWLEYGYLTRDASRADGLGYGHLAAALDWRPGGAWEARLAGRLDGLTQSGEATADQLAGDYGDSYLRWRGSDLRVTAGTQTLLWGRLDEVSSIDRLSRVDATRGILDDLPDRRRALPALRLERFFGGAKLDLAWLPRFQGAELPDRDSIWYPLDPTRGRVLGLQSTPLLATVVRNARIEEDAPDDAGGFGLRYTRTGADLDLGLTLQRTRQSLPYFRYEISRNTLVAEYPRSWLVGGDLALQAGGVTWRAEATWLETQPVTHRDGRYDTSEAFAWGLAGEFFPGDGDTRVNLQLVANHLLDAEAVLDRVDAYNLNGSIETPFAHGRWRATGRFFLGLDERDLYLNPEIAFLGWEPHELYLALHYFDGADGTLGGYYQDNRLVTLGWRASF